MELRPRRYSNSPRPKTPPHTDGASVNLLHYPLGLDFIIPSPIRPRRSPLSI
jgi:hypothetical protein